MYRRLCRSVVEVIRGHRSHRGHHYLSHNTRAPRRSWSITRHLSTMETGPSTKPSVSSDTTKLFTKASHVELYHRYRPTYPPAALEVIMNYLKAGGGNTTLNLAVDMGCGTGQATFPLAQHFSKVIGCDVSENQVLEARRHNHHDNVEYRVAPAESMPFLADGSVDLLTCALAFHWVDAEKAYPEFRRVLRRGGVLAVYAYGLPILPTPESRKIFEDFMESIKEYTSPKVELVLNEYRDVKFPLSDLSRNEDVRIDREIPLSHFIGYLSSYSPYQSLLKTHPESDVMDVLAKSLKTSLAPTATPEEDPIVHICYNVFIVLGRKE